MINDVMKKSQNGQTLITLQTLLETFLSSLAGWQPKRNIFYLFWGKSMSVTGFTNEYLPHFLP